MRTMPEPNAQLAQRKHKNTRIPHSPSQLAKQTEREATLQTLSVPLPPILTLVPLVSLFPNNRRRGYGVLTTRQRAHRVSWVVLYPFLVQEPLKTVEKIRTNDIEHDGKERWAGGKVGGCLSRSCFNTLEIWTGD